MQPQETGGFDFWHAASGMGGAVIGAGSTLLTWIIRAARLEPKIRADLQASISAAEQRVEDKVDSMAGHFNEYFEGIRRQQDEMKLNMEKEFVRKDDFREFRDEWREAMRDLKLSIANIVNKK
jgi:hypothetical protein